MLTEKTLPNSSLGLKISEPLGIDGLKTPERLSEHEIHVYLEFTGLFREALIGEPPSPAFAFKALSRLSS